MVAIEGRYCIDQFEGQLELENGQPHPFYKVVDSNRYLAKSQRGVYPQAHISRQQAESACHASGKRLCTSSEWDKACRGPDPTTYPYGPRKRSKYCNDDGVAPLAVLYGRVQYTAQSMNDPGLNRVPGGLLRTGRFSRCVNGYGVFDMVGNLHEWVEDPSGVLRGGYYLDAEELGRGCEYRAVGHAPDYRDYSTGFRCCADPHEPH